MFKHYFLSSALIYVVVNFFCSQASALENIIKQSQIEIIELKHSVEELRYLFCAFFFIGLRILLLID